MACSFHLDGCGVHVPWYCCATQDYFKKGAQLNWREAITGGEAATWEEYIWRLFFLFFLSSFFSSMDFPSFSFCNFLVMIC